MNEEKAQLTNLTRRKVLGGLGTVGLASAGAGLGTTAFFGDSEALRGILRAGEVDLKLDYRTTYEPWLDVTAEGDRLLGSTNGPVLPVADTDGMTYHVRSVPPAGATGFETVLEDDREVTLSHDDWGRATRDIVGCTDDRLVDGEVGTFVDLIDVKPGDRGETTFSLHVCGNPAVLNVRAEGFLGNENSLEDGEQEAGDASADVGELADYVYVQFYTDENCNNRKDGRPTDVLFVVDVSPSMGENVGFDLDEDGRVVPDEFGDGDETGKSGRDNDTKLDAAVEVATRIVNELDIDGTDNRAGLVSFADDVLTVDGFGTGQADLLADIDALEQTGSATNIGAAVTEAESLYTPEYDSARDQVVVLFSNGLRDDGDGGTTINEDVARSAADDMKGNGVEIYTAVFGTTTDTPFMNDLSSNPDSVYSPNIAASRTQLEEFVGLFVGLDEAAAAADTCLYAGPLSEFVDLVDDEFVGLPTAGADECAWPAELTEEDCIDDDVACYVLEWSLACAAEPMGDVPGFTDQTICEGLADDRDGDGRITMADYLLANGKELDANVVQTDDLTFDLVFRAEQCRHRFAEEEAEETAISG